MLDRLSLIAIAAQWRTRRALRQLLRPGAALIAVALFVAGLAQAFKDAEVPSATAWKRDAPLGIVGVVSAIVGLIGGFLVSIGYARELKRKSQDAELADLCKSLWVIATRTIPADFTKLGVHVWTVRGLWGARYLEKRASFIPEARRSTPITWRKGKGAIGLCWKLNEDLLADVATLEATAQDEAALEALPADERYGFSWRELQESHRYRAILAIPLRRVVPGGGRVRGCLSVDVRVDGCVNALDTLSKRDDVGAVLDLCEAVLGRKAAK